MIKGVIIDTETGSLDPRTGALTEIAAVAFQEQGGRLVETVAFQTFVIPFDGSIISDDAARVQGRTIEQIRNPVDATTEDWAYISISRFIAQNLNSFNMKEWHGKVWAHNAPFDSGFLHELELRVYGGGPKYFPEPYKAGWSDTKALATALIGAGKMAPTGGSSLDKLADAFRIARTEREAGHSALIDARITLKVLECLFVAAGWLPETQG